MFKELIANIDSKDYDVKVKHVKFIIDSLINQENKHVATNLMYLLINPKFAQLVGFSYRDFLLFFPLKSDEMLMVGKKGGAQRELRVKRFLFKFVEISAYIYQILTVAHYAYNARVSTQASIKSFEVFSNKVLYVSNVFREFWDGYNDVSVVSNVNPEHLAIIQETNDFIDSYSNLIDKSNIRQLFDYDVKFTEERIIFATKILLKELNYLIFTPDEMLPDRIKDIMIRARKKALRNMSVDARNMFQKKMVEQSDELTLQVRDQIGWLGSKVNSHMGSYFAKQMVFSPNVLRQSLLEMEFVSKVTYEFIQYLTLEIYDAKNELQSAMSLVEESSEYSNKITRKIGEAGVQLLASDLVHGFYLGPVISQYISQDILIEN